jgi:hypothetical protein
MIQKVEWGLANVPLWAFPTTDAGWDMLRDMPLYHYSTWFSNNNPDSRWMPLDVGRLREVGERLKADGKKYVITLLDRNDSLRAVYGNDIEDDRLRMHILAPFGRTISHDPKALCAILCAASRIAEAKDAVSFMLWNGAEGKRNEIPNGHQFDWSRSDNPVIRRAWERVLSTCLPVDVYGAFHHRYLYRDGDVAWHNHSNIVVRRTGWENFTEAGIHVSYGDDVEGLERVLKAVAREVTGWLPEYGYRMAQSAKARVFIHGVIHLPVGLTEAERVDAWSRAGASKVAKRDEYFGLLAGKRATEVEMLLTKMFAKGATALHELL